MPIRAYWQYYKDLAPFVFAFSIISVALTGVIWGFALHATLGIIFGLIGFSTFKKEEYYFYYNMGLTRKKLTATAFVINILLGLPFFTILLLFFLLVFGGTSIT